MRGRGFPHDLVIHGPRIRSFSDLWFMVSAYTHPTFQLSDAVLLLAARERKVGAGLQIPHCPEIPSLTLICNLKHATQTFPLQTLNEGQDKDPQEPLEDATKAGIKVQCWPWKRILTTVTSLLGYMSLYTGVSMIAPFYPIVVSLAPFSSPICSHRWAPRMPQFWRPDWLGMK